MRRGEIPYQKISDTQGGFTGTLDDEDFFGIGTASLGDLDGDGVGDLAVGAHSDDDGGPNRGAVWVLFLNPDGTVNSHQKISDTQGGFTGALDDDDFFGFRVASLGDLDGDGVGDLAVGALADDDGGPNRGAVWVLFLNPDGTVNAHQKISDTQGGFTGALDDSDIFGRGVASLGDLDGDGVGDLAVGAFRDDDGGLDRGAVWVLFLNPDGTVEAHQKISDTQGGFTGTLDDVDSFGIDVASLGDLDGDGVGDLAVSAWPDDDGGPGRGAVWILFLNADGTVESHQKISDTQGGFTGALDDEDHFGVSMTSLGDLDGDGVIDMAVGATRDDDGGLDRGAVWVLFLNPNGTVKSHRKISHTQGSFTGTLDDVYGFGVSVSSLGNLSGAGAGDLAVGALLDDDGGPDRGAVWILFLDGAFCSDEIRNGGEQCDDGNLEDGDGCDHICQIEVEDSRELSGIAAGGWIDFAINGVALEVTTHAGETAAEVAANVADAINDDPTLSQTGIYAFAIGDTVITNGMITKWLIIDPGLNPPIPPPIPGLTGWGLGLLAVLLLLTAAMTVGSAARTRT
jgi:cysteine-rich repeat protein